MSKVKQDNFWMPFTANRAFKEAPRLVVRGEGMYLWSEAGDKIIDASSGLFTCAAGHCRTEIADAVDAQLRELDYTSHFGAGYPGSFKFASQLAAITPEGIDKIFFVNSGSEAVDTAIKIALAYHRARGQGQRMRMISRERAYHGVNLGGTSLSGMVKNREAFGAGLPGVAHLRHTWISGNRFIKGQPENGAELAEDLQRMVVLYGAETIAACFVEPVAGSTGVLVPPKGYLERLREICDENGILLIFDEVICGFGRLGTPFGADAFNVTPDIMTMAKALTNGAIPMGAVAVDNAIYDTIINTAPEGAVEFFHGYTYSAHPVACAAGSAVLEIYRSESLFERAAALSAYFLDAVFSLSDIPAITDIRGYGLLAGFDLAPGAAPGLRGAEVQARLFDSGLHIKMTGDSGIIAPALIAQKEHIDEIITKLREILSQL
jgi:beta-alanine--pyruvate transaminase